MNKFQLRNISPRQYSSEEAFKDEIKSQVTEKLANDILMHFADQGGWPKDESFSVDFFNKDGEHVTAQCTVKFDEVVNCGCGQSSVPHIHTFEIELVNSV